MNNINYKQYLNCSGYDCFDNNKFSTDFLNGIVNHVSYKGLSIEQRPEILGIFQNLINIFQPQYILEIGTFAGGLTLILNDITEKINCNIITYDINNAEWLRSYVSNNSMNRVQVNTKNIFDNFYKTLQDYEIINLIKNNKILLLCDGGCKKCEFNILSQYLKSGDIIMAHDYAPNSEYFEEYMKNKIWNWHEIQDSDIIESCQKYGLQPYMREEFLSVAWACFKKE